MKKTKSPRRHGRKAYLGVSKVERGENRPRSDATRRVESKPTSQ